MSEGLIGVHVGGDNAEEVLTVIQRAEELGIPAVWMTTGGARLDSLTIFAAAAGRTRRIKFGTSIVPTFPRHPLVVVQQVQAVAHLAPGRLRLGVGPSHRPLMVPMGLAFRSPLGHLREYVQILKALLQNGNVDFDGAHYQAHESIDQPLDVPVMASALQRGSFELCGAEADGAITWTCPGPYLRDVALPAMRAGAEGAGRPVPPLIAHVPAAVHDNEEEFRAAVREQFMNPKLPFYQRMWRDSGFPEASNGEWSDAMIDAATVWGDEARVMEGLQKLFSFGATELLVSPVEAGKDREASRERTMQLLGRMAGSVGG